MGDSNTGSGPRSSDAWREYLTHGHPRERAERRIFLLLPRDPRCRVCAAPFGGLGAPLVRLIGKRQSEKNPNLCNLCFDFMARHRGGAEIECTLLFADIRGSTTLGESMSSEAFRDLLDRFYRIASGAVFSHDGSIDKFIGDEAVAMFFPLLARERHAAQGVDAALAILRGTGHDESRGPWAPVGAGVHTGQAWVGAVGDDSHVELTALGDTVNVAARLAANAAAGEVLVSAAAAEAAVLDPALERRALELKGRHELVEVVSLRVGRSWVAASA